MTTSSGSIIVRKLTHPTPEQVDLIVDLCRSAYDGDMYMMAVTASRPATEVAFYRAQLNSTLAGGEVFVAIVDDELCGVIMVFPPGQDFLAEGSQQTAYMDKYVAQLPSEMQQWWIYHLRPKYAELLRSSSLRPSIRKDAWYIRNIAVHPSYQKRGVGKKLLMDCVIRRADRDQDEGQCGVCTVDVQTDKLVRLFQKFGFRVRGTKNFSSYQGGFPLFCMLREPGGVTSGIVSRSSSGSSTRSIGSV